MSNFKSFFFFSNLVKDNKFNFKQELVDEYMTYKNNTHGFTTTLLSTRPRFRGEVKLKSNDPFDYPSMSPRYLSNKEDIQEFIRGPRIWEKLMQTPTFQSLGAKFEDTKISSCSEHWRECSRTQRSHHVLNISSAPMLTGNVSSAIFIMKTSPCNIHTLTPHFYIYIVKLGFTGVYIFFYFCSKT